MKASLVRLSTRVKLPRATTQAFKLPELSSISHTQLPNNGFGKGTYAINRSKFGNWPVYLKIQNTKTVTEIKRIQGDIHQFARDLLSIKPDLKLTVNPQIGYINVKGDKVEEIKHIFETQI